MSDNTILAIDSSSEACSVALDKRGDVFERRSDTPRSHAQRLLPMVDEVLGEAQTRLSDIDYITLVNGPGSFTGIRIALSVAQGLAYGADLPVLCVSSLVCMAYQKASVSNHECIVLSALDARMGELYWAVFKFDGVSGVPQILVEPKVSSKHDFSDTLKTFAVGLNAKLPFVGVGEGLGLDGVDVSRLSVVDVNVVPNAASALSLAQGLQPKHHDFLSADQIEPLYLRNEVTWKKRERIRR